MRTSGNAAPEAESRTAVISKIGSLTPYTHGEYVSGSEHAAHIVVPQIANQARS